MIVSDAQYLQLAEGLLKEACAYDMADLDHTVEEDEENRTKAMQGFVERWKKRSAPEMAEAINTAAHHPGETEAVGLACVLKLLLDDR